jgi:hypothetical protein
MIEERSQRSLESSGIRLIASDGASRLRGLDLEDLRVQAGLVLDNDEDGSRVSAAHFFEKFFSFQGWRG